MSFDHHNVEIVPKHRPTNDCIQLHREDIFDTCDRYSFDDGGRTKHRLISSIQKLDLGITQDASQGGFVVLGDI